MVKVTNDFGDRYSGTVGKSGTFATWRGVQYRRRYAKPSNPNTPKQQEVRGNFTNGVDKWHTFSPLQCQAYKPLASGLPMSGYNLFISRWQKMTDEGRAAYVDPYVGIKQFGAGNMSEGLTLNTVQNQAEYTNTDHPLVIGQTGFTKSTGNFDPVAVVDIVRGRVDILKTLTGALTINYAAGGKEVTDHALKTDPQAGDILYLPDMDVNYKSTLIKLAGTSQHSFEVDIQSGGFYIPYPATFTAGGNFSYKKYTPLDGVTYALVKAATQFSTFTGYSDAYGLVPVAQTSEDGLRDGNISMQGYATQVIANKSALDSVKDEYIALTQL